MNHDPTIQNDQKDHDHDNNYPSDYGDDHLTTNWKKNPDELVP